MNIPRSEHSVSRKNISPNALKVLYRLHDAGFSAYLVGGSVRDLLLGLTPKDFDIATNALPEEIKKTFRNCRLIGRRFKLAHIHFGREIVEIATFRSSGAKCHVETGIIICDNEYGTLEEDFLRRDFTINALYYNIADYSIVDFTTGMADIAKKIIRVIGDPAVRFREDPVRIIRAIRLAGKLDFTLDEETAKPIATMLELLAHISPARLMDETLKWIVSGKSLAIFELMRHYQILKVLFPQTEECLQTAYEKVYPLIARGFSNSDLRIAEQKNINPAFMLAVLMWWPLQFKIDEYSAKKDANLMTALHLAIPQVINCQRKA